MTAVLESFPAPLPAILVESSPGGDLWLCPEEFNSLRIIRKRGISPFLVTEIGRKTPVVVLCLARDRHDELCYTCVFFGERK